ncbi:MAG TPA: ATP-binding protein [Pyrinomonadaceae bacterium]|nr:ATP-binding protein [Pyrinomonadaceae bacterium]
MPSTKQVRTRVIRTVDPLLAEADNVTQLKVRPEGLTPSARDDDRLRTSEIRYRRLFESARDGILILNAASLKITDVNPFMMELLGYSRDEFLGKELWEIGLFSDKNASQQAFRELQLNGYLRYENLPLQTTDGKLREVEFVSNVYDEDRHPVIQCNIRDITDRKQAEEERRVLLASAQAARAEADTANSIKDAFLATVSHELRTPLTAILGWSEMLVSGKLDEQDSKRAVETILRNARAQREIIDDLLDISRIITGKLRLEVRSVEIDQIIEAVVEGVRPAADARTIHLHTAIDPETGPISGDPDRLQQIIWNLLSNAIKFTPEGGRVEVRLERCDSQVEVTISDTGQGIDPELLLHVFDRFRQLDSSSRRRHGGLGLGLSIVRQLVELHGGTVTAESPGTGAGTTFKVVLPVTRVQPDISDIEKTSQPSIEGNTSTDPQPSLNGLRVLVVDDERDSRELVAAALMVHGAEVVSFGSAIEALEEMERRPFDVLVSDIGMPEMDGYWLINKVRQLPAERGGRIPAAALTAYAGIEDRRRVLLAGYQLHIPKPVEPATLTAIVANLAERNGNPAAIG